MGRKYPSDRAERRRVKRSENHELRRTWEDITADERQAALKAHAEALANDPDVIAKVEEIERQIADGTFEPGPPVDLDEIRRKYLPQN